MSDDKKNRATLSINGVVVGEVFNVKFIPTPSKPKPAIEVVEGYSCELVMTDQDAASFEEWVKAEIAAGRVGVLDPPN